MTGGATSVRGLALNGKACRLTDNTASVPDEELRGLLAGLVREGRFGLSGRSISGGCTIMLDQPQLGHVQIDGQLYRLIVHRYEAWLEPF